MRLENAHDLEEMGTLETDGAGMLKYMYDESDPPGCWVKLNVHPNYKYQPPPAFG